jgi:hypothetical protein
MQIGIKHIIQLLMLLFLLLICMPQTFGDIGPGFDVQSLFKLVPIVCKATVQDIQPMPISYENRQFEGSSASLKVDRYYKGSGPNSIEVQYPSGKDLSGSPNQVYGWGFRTLAKGQIYILFLKQEGAAYRFWYDVYDTYIPINPESTSKADGFEAVREDIVNSIGSKRNISLFAMEEIQKHGWIEALPQLLLIPESDYIRYIKALVVRLHLGDRSAINESIKLFQESQQIKGQGCLPNQNRCDMVQDCISKQNPCDALHNVQNACMVAYAELGTKKGQQLIQSIASGKYPWLWPPAVSQAEHMSRMITPQEVIAAGDYIASITFEKCPPTFFNMGEKGYIVIKASGREDWYYNVQYNSENRRMIFSEMQKWWNVQGREIFAKEQQNQQEY